MSVRRALLVALITLGCASAPPASRPPRYCAPPRRTLQSAPPQQAPLTQIESVAATSDSAREETPEPEAPSCVPADGRISALEGELAQGLAAVVAPAADCRAACRATRGVCDASGEICRLTGDEGASAPQDPRCVRARAACEDATRRRTDRCPVCPAE